jgi:ketosteroid isomerase-like protein
MGLTTEDRSAIAELLARSYQLLDAGEARAYVEHFTEDGVVENPVREMAGREAIHARLVEVAPEEGAPLEQHWLGNLVVDGDGDQATAKAYMMAVTDGVAGGAATITAIYNMRYLLERVDGRWYIARLAATK